MAVFGGRTMLFAYLPGERGAIRARLAVLTAGACGRLFTLRETPSNASGRGVLPSSGPSSAAIDTPSNEPGRGERADFDAFFVAFERPLFGYVRRMVGSEEEAVDITQEAFFRAWCHFEEIAAFERPPAWLYRVATNLAVSHLRARLPLSLTYVGRPAGEDRDGESADWLTDPANVAESAAERDAIERALRLLPERQRAALLLRAVHGLSCDEIAQALDLTSAAARQTLSRARSRFRHLYESADGRNGDTTAQSR